MLTNSLMPFAYERGGALAGAATAVGFLLPVLDCAPRPQTPQGTTNRHSRPPDRGDAGSRAKIRKIASEHER